MIFGILENSRIGICTVIIFYPTIFVEKIQNILSKNVFGRKYFWIEKNTGEKNVDRIKTTFFYQRFFSITQFVIQQYLRQKCFGIFSTKIAGSKVVGYLFRSEISQDSKNHT